MKPGYFSRILSPLYYVTFFKPRQSHQHPFLLSLRTEIAFFKPVSDIIGSQPMYPIEVGWLGETVWFCERHVIH